MARGTAKTSATVESPVGPPLLLLALGFVSVFVSLPLVAAEGIPTHVLGYVAGALVPLLLIGLVRRTDLERRRSPRYVPRSLVPPALVVLMVLSLVAAGLHVWPIATELAT